MPNVISKFPHDQKKSLKKSFCYVSKVHFFVTELKLASVSSRMGKPLQGHPCKSHAKYCSALRDLFSWNYMLASMDLAFVPRWAIQQGYQIGKKPNLCWNKKVSPWLSYMCVYIYIHVFYLLSVMKESQHYRRNGVPRELEKTWLNLKKIFFFFSQLNDSIFL